MAAAAAIAIAAVPLTLFAQSRAAITQARRLLARIKLVDGAGSGLDADVVRGAGPIVVRDANGALVGAVVHADGTPISVARTVNGRSMLFEVTAAGLVSTTCPLLCYENADCTGTPYREASDALLPLVQVCGTIAYYPSGAASSLVPGSCQIVNDLCQPGTGQLTVTAVSTFDVGDLGLSPPFHTEGP